MAYTKACINWIKEYFKDNPEGKAIIGISGGKDSTIAAALCVEALGADRVIGVMMPNGEQKDIADAIDTCRFLSIPNLTINIGSTFQTLCYEIDMAGDADHMSSMEPMIKTNLPARLRMATLYAVAALYPNSRVVNTCNRSEDYVGYSTKFGCRRRLSREWQDYVVGELLTTGHCVGTSNVYLAMKYGCKPIGTYAHEYVQMYQGIPGVTLAYTNKMAMDEWFEEYQGDNGTALTDTLGTDLFLRDFDKLQAMCYTGVRHDSGDPIEWGEKMIAHYEKLGIDPKTKTLLFSDSLDFDKAQSIYNHFNGRINVSFGIGTYLSNDTNVDPLNIVIKLQYVNGHPVAKLSDDWGKSMCQDGDYLEYLKGAVNYRLAEGI